MQIEQYIGKLISSASNSSTLAFLRILHLAHQSTHQLVQDLKSHEFFSAAASLTSTSLSNAGVASFATAKSPITPATGTIATAGTGLAAVSSMLDQTFEELFGTFMEGSKYLEREGKSLTDLFGGYLLKFLNYHVCHCLELDNGIDSIYLQQATGKSKATKTVFDRVVNQLTASAQNAAPSVVSANTSPNPGGGLSAVDNAKGGFKTLLKLSGMTSGLGALTSDSKDKDTGIVLDEADGRLKLETAERMLKWHAESVGRMVELSPPADVYVLSSVSGSRLTAMTAQRMLSLFSKCSLTRLGEPTSRQP